jgi:hypothetical protein
MSKIKITLAICSLVAAIGLTGCSGAKPGGG